MICDMKEEQINKAKEWAIQHDEYICGMVFSVDDHGYPPSDEDAGRPELWKAEHWAWFVEKIGWV